MILTYLKYHILKCIPVKEASTEEEKIKIYKFRYEVYHEEHKMIEETYDHQQKFLKMNSMINKIHYTPIRRIKKIFQVHAEYII